MKLKKLPLLTGILAGGIAIATLSSSSGGGSAMGRSTVGCSGSGCHGSSTGNTATSITVTGIPSTGWVAGTAYTMTVTVSNAAMQRAGFDLSVDKGTISAGSSGTMVMGMEIHHTAPKNLVSSAASWTFTWTAPASGNGPLTVHVAGNAVNGNGSADAGDQWNIASPTFAKAVGTSIATIEEGGFSIYPNPATDMLTLTAKDSREVSIYAASMNGSFISLSAEKVGAGKYQLNTSGLASGNYVLMLNADGKAYATRFAKQ